MVIGTHLLVTRMNGVITHQQKWPKINGYDWGYFTPMIGVRGPLYGVFGSILYFLDPSVFSTGLVVILICFPIRNQTSRPGG